MAFLLRQIVAGPRAQHEETGLDLCYVTPNIIVTSGPSQTYPQLAYRNPLDKLVAFLDKKHGNGWAIWEFRAEGTGYPDEAVYGRIRHYPWPDHHPPPFRLVPLILASMRNWLAGGDDPQHRRHLRGHLKGDQQQRQQQQQQQQQYQQERQHQQQAHDLQGKGARGAGGVDCEAPKGQGEGRTGGQSERRDFETEQETGRSQPGQNDQSDRALGEQPSLDEHGSSKEAPGHKRVVVVHCKAGKGRSGSMAVSYLIAEAGWAAEDALARFTERRMRPQFGSGVSIPSQLRWVGYVDRWTRGGKRAYVDRPVEVVEIHVWGLRYGVKVSIGGFVDEGKTIRSFHTFKGDERIVVEGDAPAGGGVMDYLYGIAGYYGSAAGKAAGALEEGGAAEEQVATEDVNYHDVVGEPSSGQAPKKDGEPAITTEAGEKQTKSEKNAAWKMSQPKSKMLNRVKTSRLIRKISTRNISKSISTNSATSSPTGLSAGSKNNLIRPPSASSSLSAPSNPEQSSSVKARADSPAASLAEPGGQAVILRPRRPVRMPTSDVNVSVERRNRAPGGVMGLAMVTALAHVWFNAFFEGAGAERAQPDDDGVFEIDWDALDGLKGSSQKGTRACDRLSIVWRFADADGGHKAEGKEEEEAERKGEQEGSGEVGEGNDVLTTAAEAAAAARRGGDEQGAVGPGVSIVSEPGQDDAVPEMAAADWKGGNDKDSDGEKRLGLRKESADSAGVSRASSVKGVPLGGGDSGNGDDESIKGVKTSGPLGDEGLDEQG